MPEGKEGKEGVRPQPQAERRLPKVEQKGDGFFIDERTLYDPDVIKQRIELKLNPVNNKDEKLVNKILTPEEIIESKRILTPEEIYRKVKGGWG